MNTCQPDAPQSFGFKCFWIAVRTGDNQAVAEAMGLREIKICNWLDGVSIAYDRESHRVFITPPLRGWVLAAGWTLPPNDLPETAQKLKTLLENLGHRFSEVQYFGTYRVADYHSWIRLVNGNVVRAYAYGDGETFLNVGEPDQAEAAIRETFLREFGRKHPEVGKDYEYMPDEEDVMSIATTWSIDPSRLEEMGLPPGVGLVGELPQ